MLRASYRRLKQLLPNSFKHLVKKCLGLVPPEVKPSKELVVRYEQYVAPPAHEIEPCRDSKSPLTSSLCRQDFFASPSFRHWHDVLRKPWELHLREVWNFSGLGPDELIYHRKIWEFAYIVQALYERQCLGSDKKGLGFAVGTEPIPALFARLGCRILATDLAIGETTGLWGDTGQHCLNDLSILNRSGLCPPELFSERVSFRNVDMNAIPDDLEGFDFCWSSCAFEHVGPVAAGVEFVRNAMKTLKPGGVAVHTTEFNLSSEDRSAEWPNLTFYCKKDIQRLAKALESDGHFVEPFDFSAGRGEADSFVDLPPYFRKRTFLKFWMNGCVATSIGLIVRKSGAPS